MSETELRKGILTPVVIVDESMEFTAQLIIEKHHGEPSIYDGTYLTSLKERGYEHSDYHVTESAIYQVEEKETLDDCDDIYDATLNEDKTISFTLKYYNGGCSFDEAMDNALKSIT